MGLSQRRIYRKRTPSLSTHSPNINETLNNKVDKNKRIGSKYKNSALSKGMSNNILNKLEVIMNSDKPYLSSELTLLDLAESCLTLPNYLSQTINEQLNINFFDYVNSHRIKHAKHLLLNPNKVTPTILDIAMTSGFNSKSAFYNAFKKSTKMTPSAFKLSAEKSK